ncbi:MAG: hypothetical protein CO113_01785 [Elusimicrobia bacterium CG_4_9_14_3_um_filter_62_55]|nr:MAG: hypothetical protein CO113_01785 [Elusimicrobia bacterium CG_4_9_14_3_um_filter_62_55]
MSAQENEPATRGDIARLDGKIDGGRGELKAVEGRLDAKIDSVRGELKAVEGRLDAKIDGLDAKIDSVRRELKVDIFKTNETMAKMEQRLVHLIRGESEKTIERIDAFLGKIEGFERETYTLPKTLDAHGEQLRDHEKRIAAVESSHNG